MLEHVKRTVGPDTSADHIRLAFWYACHGGQQPTAEFLLAAGADLNWLPPWERLTPFDAAVRSGFHAVADWLGAKGARSAAALH